MGSEVLVMHTTGLILLFLKTAHFPADTLHVDSDCTDVGATMTRIEYGAPLVLLDTMVVFPMITNPSVIAEVVRKGCTVVNCKVDSMFVIKGSV